MGSQLTVHQKLEDVRRQLLKIDHDFDLLLQHPDWFPISLEVLREGKTICLALVNEYLGEIEATQDRKCGTCGFEGQLKLLTTSRGAYAECPNCDSAKWIDLSDRARDFLSRPKAVELQPVECPRCRKSSVPDYDLKEGEKILAAWGRTPVLIAWCCLCEHQWDVDLLPEPQLELIRQQDRLNKSQGDDSEERMARLTKAQSEDDRIWSTVDLNSLEDVEARFVDQLEKQAADGEGCEGCGRNEDQQVRGESVPGQNFAEWLGFNCSLCGSRLTMTEVRRLENQQAKPRQEP